MSLSPPLFLLSQLVLLLLSLSARMEEEALDLDEVDVVVVVLMGMCITLGVVSPESLLLSGSNSVVKVMVVVVVMVAAKSNVFGSSVEFLGVYKNDWLYSFVSFNELTLLIYSL